MIRSVIFTVYFSLSECPEKLLTHFATNSSVVMKLTRIWRDYMEIIQVTLIIIEGTSVNKSIFFYNGSKDITRRFHSKY